MEDKVSEIREFLAHMAYEYGTSGMSVFDTKIWAEGVLETFDELFPKESDADKKEER